MSTPLMFMLVAMAIVEGELIDIKKEVANVLKQHNKERSSRHLKAADMLEMVSSLTFLVLSPRYVSTFIMTAFS